MLTLLLAPSVGCFWDCCPNLFVGGYCSLRELQAVLTPVNIVAYLMFYINMTKATEAACRLWSCSKLDIYNNSLRTRVSCAISIKLNHVCIL